MIAIIIHQVDSKVYNYKAMSLESFDYKYEYNL